jgi:hypothetical protein
VNHEISFSNSFVERTMPEKKGECFQRMFRRSGINDGDGPLEIELERISQEGKTIRIGGRIGDPRRLDPDALQIRRRQIDRALAFQVRAFPFGAGDWTRSETVGFIFSLTSEAILNGGGSIRCSTYPWRRIAAGLRRLDELAHSEKLSRSASEGSAICGENLAIFMVNISPPQP